MKQITMKGYGAWMTLAAVVVGTIIYLIYTYPTPPMEEISSAREMLQQARLQKAASYKKEELTRAVSYYDSAMNMVNTENDRFFLFRDYALSKYYADRANFWALSASKDLKEAHINHKERVNVLSEEVKFKLDHFKNKFSHLPISKKDARQLSKAKMLFREANLRYTNKNLSQSEEKLIIAASLIDELNFSFTEKLQDYFKSYRSWSDLYNSAVDRSGKTKSKVLIVDKYARKCYLYSSGRLIESFDIELGLNWMGDKQHAGDKTTPEGIYKILEKKNIGNTRYYKAFLLDYPNLNDKKRFAENKASGRIPENSSIGSLIEIHGSGGKGYDWTDGCVALRNDDMDRLFSACAEGTPIVIVGSMVSLDQILQ